MTAGRPALALAAAFGLAASGGVAPASAHGGGSTGYAQVTVQGGTVRYAFSLPADAVPGGISADLDELAATVAGKVSIAADGRPCAAVPAPATPPAPGRATLEVVVLYACAGPVGEMVIVDAMSEVLGPGHHTLAEIELNGRREPRSFEADGREARIGVPTAGPPRTPPKWGLPEVLSGFLGVAGGLALLLAALMPLLAWSRRLPWRRGAVWAASGAALLAAILLLVGRMLLSVP